MFKVISILLIFIVIPIIGCNFDGEIQGSLGEDPTLTLAGHLLPYSTATQTPVPDQSAATQSATPHPTDIPPPTLTPIVYQVVENDTLTGIALKHSVGLEDLVAANPGIDPNFLTIGLTLTIPFGGNISAALPTSTPIPIVVMAPVCHPLADGKLQCISGVENDQDYAVENVVVTISLQSPDGDSSVSQVAIPPLNIIQAGQKVAVSASFSSPLLPSYMAHASLLSVIPVSPDDQRYLTTELIVQEIEISQDGQQASITGVVVLPTEPSNVEQPNASSVWVTAFAYDRQNNIVGIRKWVADDALFSGDQIKFDFIVYSLGPPIEYVDILTETQP